MERLSESIFLKIMDAITKLDDEIHKLFFSHFMENCHNIDDSVTK